jgi:hypothetical protein
MMHVLPCVQVREDLAAYHDGELEIEAQVLIHGHLKECVACRLEAAALADLGAALRTMAGSVPGRAPSETGLITEAVLGRITLERRLSLGARLRESFDDMHLVWAGLGATFAMLFCVFASAGVLHAASQERPDSLAGIISTIASGSTPPVRLANAYENQPLLDTTEALPLGFETELMLSAFVTRDGRIQNVALLEEQARTMNVKPEVIVAMIDAASRARFSPKEAGANVVWLVTSTTVKGRPDYDLYLLSPPRLALPAMGPKAAPKPRASGPAPEGKSTTAGDDAISGFSA